MPCLRTCCYIDAVGLQSRALRSAFQAFRRWHIVHQCLPHRGGGIECQQGGIAVDVGKRGGELPSAGADIGDYLWVRCETGKRFDDGWRISGAHAVVARGSVGAFLQVVVESSACAVAVSGVAERWRIAC